MQAVTQNSQNGPNPQKSASFPHNSAPFNGVPGKNNYAPITEEEEQKELPYASQYENMPEQFPNYSWVRCP
jgi:hypothetical protein